jgi:Amt family ammonium transporter
MTTLIAAKILGPRIGRFTDSAGNPLPEPASFPPHSATLQVLGTISSSESAAVSALAAVTTTISAATGSVSALLTDMIINRRKTGEIEYDITMCMNGALSGLVAITAGCAVMAPWAAFVTGAIGGWVYIFFSKLLDAVDAIRGKSTLNPNRHHLCLN